jgi:hypothetical protein
VDAGEASVPTSASVAATTATLDGETAPNERQREFVIPDD